MWTCRAVCGVALSLFTGGVVIYSTVTHEWWMCSGVRTGLWDSCVPAKSGRYLECSSLSGDRVDASLNFTRFCLILATIVGVLSTVCILMVAGNGNLYSKAGHRAGIGLLFTGFFILIGSCFYAADKLPTVDDGQCSFGTSLKLAWVSIVTAVLGGCVVAWEDKWQTKDRTNYESLT
ncbi:uncharacterized protein LOC144440340 [Glandiceps talaboti]